MPTDAITVEAAVGSSHNQPVTNIEEPQKDAPGKGGGTIVKGVLFGLGAIAIIGIALSLFKLALLALVVGGVGYAGLKLLGGSGKQLPSGEQPRQLSSEIDRRMDELNKLDKKLDEQIAALSKDRKT